MISHKKCTILSIYVYNGLIIELLLVEYHIFSHPIVQFEP